ncbi:MAG: M48 family metallopeptidase [Candidatus Thermoplasmatota archaeon]|nr:M48 family metallopeptidase [Candidatus Thermoplasmatota archaeon]
METEILEINGTKYPVKIHYEKRKNSRVSIRRTTINIRIPSFLEDKEKNEQLKKMKNWAKSKIIENPEKFRPKQQKEYKDSDIVEINDEEFILRIEFKDKKSSSARLAGNTIKLSVSNNLSKEEQNNHISSLISRCIAYKRLPKLQEKIYKLNKTHFSQKINKIFFKHNKSNWGSCSNAGNINISTRLLFAPDDILEYVCIHELAHLIEQNHSNKFWSLVEKAMPDYKEKERWLKENGKLCKF